MTEEAERRGFRRRWFPILMARSTEHRQLSQRNRATEETASSVTIVSARHACPPGQIRRVHFDVEFVRKLLDHVATHPAARATPTVSAQAP